MANNNKPVNQTNTQSSNWGSWVSAGASFIPGVANLVGWWSDGYDNPEEQKLKALGEQYENEANTLGSTQFSGSKQSLLKQSQNLPYWEQVDIEDFGGETNPWMAGLSGLASGAAAGASTGSIWGAIGGGVLGGLLGGLNAAESNAAKEEQITEANRRGQQAEQQAARNFNYALDYADAMDDRFRKQQLYNNIAAFGGLLETNGANFKTGASFIEDGGSHESNPFEGVQFGIASDGMPNLVEEGEVVIKIKNNDSSSNDYVLSAREYPTLQEIRDAKITSKPERYEGKSWAEIYKDITDKNNTKEIINRTDTKEYMDSLHQRISQAQEATKLREKQEAIMKRLKEATPDEQNFILQQLGYGNPVDGAMFAHGGKIFIKPENRGKFTATKKRTGKTTEELTHSKNPLTRKRAIFAQNAKKWSHKHPDGGYLDYFGTATSNLLGQNANYNSIYNNTIGVVNADKQRKLQEQDYANNLLNQYQANNLLNQYQANNLLNQYQLEAETPVIVDFNNNGSPIHYTNKGASTYEGATPKFVTVTPGQETDSTLSDSINSTDFTFDRDLLLPITSGLNVLTDALGVTNTADYSNANRIERDVMQPTLVGYTPTGRYIQPKLVDQNYIATRIANQGNTGISAAKDLSSGNSATALANIMAQNYNTQQAIGNAMAQSEVANNKALQDAIAFNNAIDRANVEGVLKADMANQSILENYARRHAAQTTAASNLRESIDNQVNANRSANWNNFLENLQGYFDNQRNRTMANDALSRIYGCNIQSDGHILFTNNNKKKTFANDYDINLSDVDKVTEKDGDFYLNGKKLTRKGE